MEKPNYFQVALSCSVVIFGFDGKQLLVATQMRNEEPFKGAPMLPSEMVLPNQDINEVLNDILTKVFGFIPDNHTEQLKAFANLYRNSKGRVVNVAQYALVSHAAAISKLKPEYEWHKLSDMPNLVFDHSEIFAYSLERLKRRVKRRPIGFHLLPELFTFKQIFTLYKQALRKDLDKRNFRKKLLKSDLLIETDQFNTWDDNKKASRLYTFNTKKYEKLTLKGYDFSFY